MSPFWLGFEFTLGALTAVGVAVVMVVILTAAIGRIVEMLP